MRGTSGERLSIVLQRANLSLPATWLLQLDTRITLGYEYFLIGDYANAARF